MLSASTRVAVALVATLMLLGGLGLIAIGGTTAISGLWPVIAGAVVLVALAIERNRYRSEAAERSFESVGPGGGEPPGSLDGRFVPPTRRSSTRRPV
ncbi:MAG: hypothetical protein H0V73_01315 [Chloroflexi bacterium]|nr:hypothetical protein [Chloroflexota bacterium]